MGGLGPSFHKDTGAGENLWAPLLTYLPLETEVPLRGVNWMRTLLECSIGGEGAVEGLRLLVVRRGEGGERGGPYCQGVLPSLTSTPRILSTAPLMH